MAEVKTYVDDNRQPVEDREFRKFIPDKVGDVAVNVVGKNIESLLTAIASGVGGAVDTTPTIYNVACPIAGQEYSQALPANTKGFLLKARGNSKILFAYSSGATSQLTIFPGAVFEDDNFYTSKTIYFICSKADEIVEVVTYV